MAADPTIRAKYFANRKEMGEFIHKIALDNTGLHLYDTCIGRLLPIQQGEVRNDIAKVVWSLAISKLRLCVIAEHEELGLGS
jgi:hypothetical protein